MALNIKDPMTERLAAEVAELTGDTKTGAIRKALQDVRDRLAAHEDVDQRDARLLRFLEDEIWPLIPPGQLGVPISQEEQDEILGYGPAGV